MRIRSVAFLLLTLAIVILPHAPAGAQLRGDDDGEAAEYGWLSSLSAAKDQARKTARPLMVMIRCVP